MRRWTRLARWVLAILILVIGVGLIAAAVAGWLSPLRLVARFPMSFLSKEAGTMTECRECHEAEKFHDCQTCHDEHGSAELALVPFDDLLLFQGDVPESAYIAVNEILPYRDQPNTHRALLDFLTERGVSQFESVTLASRDEGFVTIERTQLTQDALLLPHVDGIRFADDNLHISTWLKGVWRIIVVGDETPLRIDGEATSIGRLLLGPTRSVTIEQTDVMFKSPDDAQVRKAKTAGRIEGAPIELLVAHPAFQRLVVRDEDGKESTLTAEEAQGALVAQVRNRVTLVLPSRNRSQWLAGVAEIVSEE